MAGADLHLGVEVGSQLNYITTWITKRNVTFFGWKIKKELRTLNPEQLNETVEVLKILTGMVGDEIRERAPSTPIQ